MFTNQSDNTYNIIIPTSTSKEIVEWFAIMDNNNKLVDAMIELINASIKSGRKLIISDSFMDNCGEKPQPLYKQQLSQDSFLDN